MTTVVSAPAFELIWWIIIGAAVLTTLAMGVIIQHSVNKSRKECQHLKMHWYGKQSVTCPDCDRLWFLHPRIEDKP